MIELRGINFRYDEHAVLRDVDLTLDEGELVLVSGRTGVGKSTLLGVVTGLVPRFTGGVLTGDVLLDGVSIVEQPPRERAHLVGYVSQDPLAGFVADTVEEELAYGMEQLGTPVETMRRRVEETLDLLGIADLRSRDLRTLSGGQQQRVAIGSVLTMHPRVLVLDEPTSALDPTAAEDVLAAITRLVHDLGLTVLLAEHRLERVVPFADRICLVTGDGSIRVDRPERILADSPVAPPLVELARLAGWEPLPLTVRDARRHARSLPELTPLPAAPVVRRRAAAGRPGDHRRARPARRRTRGGPDPLDRPRDGADGTQRVRQVQPDLGAPGLGQAALRVARRRRQRPRRPDARRASYARGSGARRRPPTCSTSRPSRRSARRDAGAAADAASDAATGACRALLDRLAPGIEETMHPRDLSEGQRLALALSIVLTARPPVVLLDEPTRGLDYAGKAELARIVADLAGDGHAVLLATHDVEFAAHVADEVVVLAEGEIVSSGPPRRVLAESPSFAPQVTKVLGAPWLTVDEVAAALEVSP